MDRDFVMGAEHANARDAADPLEPYYEQFHHPEAEVYMDGNSLGLSSEAAEGALTSVYQEWQELAIEGWSEGEPPWFEYGERLGDRCAPLVGAAPESCVVTGGTTINIHALLGTFLRETEGSTVLANELDFPSDHYAIRAQLRQRNVDPSEGLILVESADGRTIDTDAVRDAIATNEPDIVFMPSVLYRSGQLLDIATITETAHEYGALAGFDLAHSIGVVPHELDAADVDFAVWCSYKYLNGGPGAVGGLYVNSRHFDVPPALPGWWGHEKSTQFEMQPEFTPAEGAGAWQISTPPLLAMAPLDGALDIITEAGIEKIRSVSLDMTAYLQFLIDERLSSLGFECGTPRKEARRGGHVAIEHDEAFRISQALRDEGIIVDYRPPNVIRVCPAPLSTRYTDIHTVVETLRSVVIEDRYEEYDPDASGVT